MFGVYPAGVLDYYRRRRSTVWPTTSPTGRCKADQTRRRNRCAAETSRQRAERPLSLRERAGVRGARGRLAAWGQNPFQRPIIPPSPKGEGDHDASSQSQSLVASNRFSPRTSPRRDIPRPAPRALNQSLGPSLRGVSAGVDLCAAIVLILLAADAPSAVEGLLPSTWRCSPRPAPSGWPSTRFQGCGRRLAPAALHRHVGLRRLLGVACGRCCCWFADAVLPAHADLRRARRRRRRRVLRADARAPRWACA